VNECGRCGAVDRDVRMSLVNLEREARQEGLPHAGSDYSHELRCRDKAACLARATARRQREDTRG